MRCRDGETGKHVRFRAVCLLGLRVQLPLSAPIFGVYISILIFAFCVSLFLAGCATGGPHLKFDSSLVKDIRTFDSVEYIPLIKLCDRYNLKYDWDPFARTAKIERGGKSIVLRAGAKSILVNGNERTIE